MTILVDSAMPYWEAFFHSFASDLAANTEHQASEVVPFTAPLNQSLSQLSDAYLSKVEILLVRSTTKVDTDLIKRLPNLRFVGTATAGFDHLDTELLNHNNITWVSAGGCNAQAVAQYVTSALLNIAEQDSFLLHEKTYAVVGHGNVGSRVAKTLKAIGCKVIVYDPPLQAKLEKFDVKESENRDANAKLIKLNREVAFSSFDDVLATDIICVHAPLNSDLNFPSLHLFNEKSLRKLRPTQYLINAGRGELIDNQALLTLFSRNADAMPQVVLDVWENEPEIDTRLLPFLRFATQHIAGHTLEGKAMGTRMLYSSLCEHFKMTETVDLNSLLPLFSLSIDSKMFASINDSACIDDEQVQGLARGLANLIYDIKNDDSVFRALMAQSRAVGKDFAQSRQKYPIRREFSALDLNCENIRLADLLRALGFIIS